jgi:hypothetical protein
MKSASCVCIDGYTFRMKVVTWLLVLAAIGVFGYAVWTWRRRWQEQQRASEERFASFLAQARPAAPAPEAPAPAPDASLPQQRLLLEAAAKAGEAGERRRRSSCTHACSPAFQMLRSPGRSAIEAQKQKLAKA